jgi:hypothetical protein
MSKKNVLSCCDIIAWSSKYVLKWIKCGCGHVSENETFSRK